MELNFELLKTEALDDHIYRGQTVDIGAPQLYGGLVMGQAVYAASQTVPSDRMIHSMHAYFILPVDPYAPIIYQIDPIR
jgi:acyl-CoA thioesterase-2